MIDSIYTFEIIYDNLDGFGSVQFCSHTKEEAVQFFNTWCTGDNALDRPIPIIDIQKVHNEADALEYGILYGTAENI